MIPEQPPFTTADSLAAGGPNSAMLDSAVGAFADETTWLAGWTNFSASSTPEDDGSVTKTETVSDDITSNTTWSADTVYVLDDQVRHGEPSLVLAPPS